MAVSRDIDTKKIEWVEWENRHGATMAHAVDPGSEQRTGIKRTVTGAIIPSSAVKAKPGTERDAFSVQVLERIEQVQAERAAAEEEKSAKKEAAEKAKAAKVAERQEKAAEAAKQRAEKKAAADAAKAEKAASRVTATPAPDAPAAAKPGKLKRQGANFLVLDGEGTQVGMFDAERLDGTKGITLVLNEKLWVVNQNGKKVAQGAIKAAKK